jgi:hypothetical protein
MSITTAPTLSRRLVARVAAATLLAGLGLSFGASVAAAQPPFSQDPSTARMVCEKNGGAYAPPTDVSGSTCLYPDDSGTLCDLNNVCTFNPPDRRPRAPHAGPVIPGNIGNVDNVHVITGGVPDRVPAAVTNGLK